MLSRNLDERMLSGNVKTRTVEVDALKKEAQTGRGRGKGIASYYCLFTHRENNGMSCRTKIIINGEKKKRMEKNVYLSPVIN